MITDKESGQIQRVSIGWRLALGIGMMLLGIISFMLPFVTTIAVTTLAGLVIALGGIMLFIHAFRWKVSARFFINLFLGLLYFAFGAILVVYPLTGALTLTILLTAFLLATGVIKIVDAVRMRPARNWGWLLFSGILSAALGLLIWAGLPITAFWALGVIVAIDLIFSGLSLVMISLAMCNADRSGESYCIGNVCYSGA